MRPASFALLLCMWMNVACMNENHELMLTASTEEPAPSIMEMIQSRFKDEGLSIAVNVATESDEIFESIRNKTVDLGVVEEPNHPIPGIVTIAPLYPSVLHVLYNRETKPTDFAQLLRQSNVYVGPLNGAARRLLSQLASDFGVAEDEYQLLDNPWTVTPDIYFIFGGLLSNDSIRQLSDYRLFSFADPDDVAGGSVADAIVLKHHHLKAFLLPKSTYYTLNDEPVVTLSTRTVIIAHETFSANLAFDIASHLFNHAQEYSINYPLVTQELNVNFNPIELIFPLHSGSKRFIDRDKPGFIERYISVIAVLVPIFLALSSGLFALYRHRRNVRKDQIDYFYSKLLAIRNEIEQTTEDRRLKSLRGEVIIVQQEVLNLLIEKRMSANISMVAFLSLSNQIINELDHRIDYNS